MDDADRAGQFAEVSERALMDRVARRRAAAVAPALPDCAACGEPIGAARQAAVPGCTLCVGCQAQLERGT